MLLGAGGITWSVLPSLNSSANQASAFVLPGFGSVTTEAATTSASASASVSVSMSMSLSTSASSGPISTVPPAQINLAAAPRGTFDPADEQLRAAATTFERALTASTVEEEEALWTVVLASCARAGGREWVPDIASRALGNRGNARSRQGRLQEALEDFNESIRLAPYAVDPVLNRGVALEAMGRFQEAAADYRAVLAVAPNDPSAWNNMGNVEAALGDWSSAAASYLRASTLSPTFSFAKANYALALYQVGEDNAAIKQMRNLLRKYPEFPDVRAALSVALYAAGLRADAENNWSRMEDGRYRDRVWVSEYRRWPPRLVSELAAFLDLQPV